MKNVVLSWNNFKNTSSSGFPRGSVQNQQTSVGRAPGRYDTGDDLKAAFNDFLHIDAADLRLLRPHHDALLLGGERFAEIFYAYLLDYPATAQVLEQYQAGGGKIENLVKKQLQHLFAFLEGRMDEESARNMAHIGEVHYRYRIEPVWIMGAYLLYLEHLQTLIRTSTTIRDTDREALDAAVTKLLFRDMGLMLEGYWNAAGETPHQEQEKAARREGQIN